MHRRNDGIMIGCLLGLILVNSFFCQFENQWLSECPTDILPKVFKRYVDDIFCSVTFLITFKQFCKLHEHYIPKHYICFGI